MLFRSLRYLSGDEVLVARYADPHMWDKNGLGGSYAEDFIVNGWTIQRANNDRHEGWARIHGMLATHDMLPPELIIMKHCTTLIKAFPEAPRDKMDVEDLDTHYKHDHILDALRYGSVGGRRMTKRLDQPYRSTYRVGTPTKVADDNGLLEDLFGKGYVGNLIAGRRN